MNPASSPAGRGVHVLALEPLAVVAAALIAWELLPRLALVPTLLLPPVSTVITYGWAQWPTFEAAAHTTMLEVALALFISTSVGMAIGFLIGSFRPLHGLLALSSAIYAVPVIAVYPLLCAWLGYGPEPRILLAVFISVIPIILTVGEATRLVDRKLIRLARSLGASRIQLLVKLYFPTVLPAVISAVRIGSALVLIGVVIGQMLLSSSGLGYLITQFRTSVNPQGMYSAALLVIAIALAADFIFYLLLRSPRLRPYGVGQSQISGT